MINRSLSLLRMSVALLAVVLVVTAVLRMESARDGLSVHSSLVDGVPVTVFGPARAPGPLPVVVLAHGFAGSQQLMHPFAITRARAGVVAVTFDLPAHGRNPQPLPGGLSNVDGHTRVLMAALGRVVEFARSLPGGDGRVALLGHSMASDLVIMRGREDARIEATVAVSPFARGVTRESPRNLLVVVGDLEPAMLKDSGLAVVREAGGAAAGPGETYGRFADGTARRLVLSPGVEHIGVLYGAAGLVEARDWLLQAFGQAAPGAGFVDDRGSWILVLYSGLVLLAWPLATLLPRVSEPAAGAALPWRRLLPAALVPAVLTPLLLRVLPTEFLPILLGDYLLAHFAVYGLLTAALLWRGRAAPASWTVLRMPVFWLVAAVAAAYATLAFGLATDRYAFGFLPTAARVPLIFAMLAGTGLYFLADEWLVRGAGPARGSYPFSKFCFLVSLAIALALEPQRLFFLAIIIPAILAFFLVYGMLSSWLQRRTGHPWVAGIANAVAFAWFIAAAFPLVSR
jgi:hypothetical protein